MDKKSLRENLYSFLRKCCYIPFYDSYIKLLSSGSYPRFHIHAQETEKQYILNLHIDQKRPSYGKETAHSGEYEGNIVEKEAERIKSLTLPQK